MLDSLIKQESDMIAVDSIRSDGGTQARIQLDWIAIDEYSKAMQEGAQFPPIVVFHDGKDYWLADGFHRLDAAKRAGIEKIACDVRMGTVRDAILHAVGANADHGVRRTNADKRAAVMRLLEDDEWRGWSDREIARRCRVHHSFVAKQRENHTGYIASMESDERTFIHPKTGKPTTMNTANIGGSGAKDSNNDLPDTDKRAAVMRLLEDEEWRHWPDSAIARRCGVSPEFVSKLRKSLSPEHHLRFQSEFDDRAKYSDPVPDPQPKRVLDIHFSSETPEHYTPKEIITATLSIFGSIYLDPCSNSKTSPNVPATKHYTKEDDGLTQFWEGNVYMNPPYGRGIEDWVRKLVEAYEAQDVEQAIALLPARPDTQWWQTLRNFPCCFITGRLKFIGNDDPAPFPSAVFYLGTDMQAFYEAFSSFGDIWTRIDEGWFTE